MHKRRVQFKVPSSNKLNNMKNSLKLLVLLITIGLVYNCSGVNHVDECQLISTNIGKYSISIPKNYKILYSDTDSIRGKIIGEGISIDFITGYIPIASFQVEKNSGVKVLENDSTDQNLSKILLLKDNHGESISCFFCDLTTVSSTFGTVSMDGINLHSADLDEQKKELVLKIFNTVKRKS